MRQTRHIQKTNPIAKMPVKPIFVATASFGAIGGINWRTCWKTELVQKSEPFVLHSDLRGLRAIPIGIP